MTPAAAAPTPPCENQKVSNCEMKAVLEEEGYTVVHADDFDAELDAQKKTALKIGGLQCYLPPPNP